MSRFWMLVGAILATLGGIWASAVFGAPAALDCAGVSFTEPAPGSTLSGSVEISGRALIQDFRFYKVEYSPIGREQWVLIGTDVVRRPVENGRLVVWPTTLVPDGTYALRLHVVDPTGNYCQVVLSPVTVQNARTTEPESPTPTDVPMLTVVPPQPTPTSPASVPVEFAPVQGTPGALPTRVSPIQLPGANPAVLAVFFVFGALATVAIVLFVGLVMFVRRLG